MSKNALILSVLSWSHVLAVQMTANCFHFVVLEVAVHFLGHDKKNRWTDWLTETTNKVGFGRISGCRVMNISNSNYSHNQTGDIEELEHQWWLSDHNTACHQQMWHWILWL